jgi:hypothetical protein
MSLLDLRDQNLPSLDSSLIPADAEFLFLSLNQFVTLPSLRPFPKLWVIDLRGNLLIDLSFLACFAALGYLDLRDNFLTFDELRSIRHIYIEHLRIDGNEFTKFTDAYPLTLTAILERVWIIDGQFISDFIRAQARAFSRTLAFGETVLSCRRFPTAVGPHTGASQAAAAFLGSVRETGEIVSPGAVILKTNDLLPQINRLRQLMGKFTVELPHCNFVCHLGLALGILAMEWINEPIGAIPEVVCPGFWVAYGDEIEKLEPYERMLLLLKIGDVARPQSEMDRELWDCLGIVRFLQTGDIPMRGTSQRLLISAFLERCNVVPHNVDRSFYLKIREYGNFAQRDMDIEQIHAEILGPLSAGTENGPCKNEKVAVVHPVTEEWVTATCLFCRNGRVFTKADGEVIQIPLAGLFCDNGKWREAKRRREKPHSRILDDWDGMSQGHFPTIPEPAQSDTRLLLRRSRRLLSKSMFIDRTVRPVEPFRGIVEPVKPVHVTLRRSVPTRKPTQFIQDVVNVTLGPEIGHGKRTRKFNVRVQNALTGRSQYQWVGEEEVSQEDVEMLVKMYRNHIEAKVTVIPGL